MQDGERGAQAPDSDDDYIRISQLTCVYGDGKPAVDRLSVTIARGEFVGVLGPSGCGKSTTLKMIAGLVQPSSGSIHVGGNALVDRPAWERNLGLVFQNYALFPHMSVAQNVAFGLRLRRRSKSEISERVAEALRLVRLEGLGDRRPSELSGGQQQRVAIARSIVIRPDILLLDEPLSNLDAKLRNEMRIEIREIQQRIGITTIFVTHDQQEALTMCDRIAVMNEGALAQVGTQDEIYNRADSPFVATFIGRANTFACDVACEAGARRLRCNGAVLPSPAALPEGDRVTAMVRPHRMRIVPPADDVPCGEVARRIFIGNLVEAEIDFGEGPRVLIEMRPGSEDDALAVPGARVGFTWPGEATMVFTA